MFHFSSFVETEETNACVYVWELLYKRLRVYDIKYFTNKIKEKVMHTNVLIKRNLRNAVEAETISPALLPQSLPRRPERTDGGMGRSGTHGNHGLLV